MNQTTIEIVVPADMLGRFLCDGLILFSIIGGIIVVLLILMICLMCSDDEDEPQQPDYEI